MDNTFEILDNFLDRFGPEVEGHELAQPSEELGRQLRQFARGDLPQSQHKELLGLLKLHPELLRRLAEEVKTLRRQSERQA